MEVAHSVTVRLSDVNRHHDRAKKHGAKILHPPDDYPMVKGNIPWKTSAASLTFTPSTADIDSKKWGGTPGNRKPPPE